MTFLTKEERERYQKLIGLEEMGVRGQLALKNASALVVGAGGLGSGVLPLLCAAGIGHVGLVEHDVVENSNLQRQTLYKPGDQNKHKSELAAGYLQSLNPHIKLSAFDQPMNQDNAGTLTGDFDVVVDCTDNFETRLLINDTCARLNKPLVYGSVSDYEGQVMVLHHKRKADLRKIYGEMPNDKYPADGIIPTLPHIIGSIQANETIKLLTDSGKLLDGRMLLFNAYTNQCHVIELE